MILRIQYLADNGYLPDYIPVSKAYLDIKNKVTIVRNLVLKYNVTKNNVLLNRAANLLRSIKLEEELALRDLLKKIKYIEK
jgi:putative lipase involved disintegration of autophagic bodies